MEKEAYKNPNVRKVITESGITSEFWEMLRYDLQEVYQGAILDLTRTVPTVDNLAVIAGLQARANLAQELMSKPYNLLGIPRPR